jgi:hypothetical protein
MTKSTAQELPREASLDQSPPLYEELKQPKHCHHHCHYAVPDLPSPTAKPTEVADFLVRLLVANEVPIDRATRIASKWTVESGKELRNYPTVLYLDVFGKEDAWVTYPAVKQAVQEEKSKDSWWHRNGNRKYHLSAEVVGTPLTLS